MHYIPYPTFAAADQRSREMWAAVRGPGWRPGNVTTHLYGVRVRTGDEEADASLPDGVDFAIVIADRGPRLDKLVREEQLTAAEVSAVVTLYPAWRTGMLFAADDITAHVGKLYKAKVACVSAQPPDETPLLFKLLVKTAEALPIGA